MCESPTPNRDLASIRISDLRMMNKSLPPFSPALLLLSPPADRSLHPHSLSPAPLRPPRPFPADQRSAVDADCPLLRPCPMASSRPFPGHSSSVLDWLSWSNGTALVWHVTYTLYAFATTIPLPFVLVVSFFARIALWPLALTPLIKPVYVYFTVAALVGLVAGVIIHVVSLLLVFLLGADKPEPPDSRPPSRSGARVPVHPYDSMFGTRLFRGQERDEDDDDDGFLLSPKADPLGDWSRVPLGPMADDEDRERREFVQQ